MGVQPVHLVEHPLRVGELRVGEVHGIPQIVVSPVLPVLDDAVQGYTQFAVFADDADRLVLTLVAFLALPVTVGPQREHRRLTRQRAHPCHHAVGIAAVEEIVVGAESHLRVEGGRLAVVGEGRRGVVVPVEPVALDGLEEGAEVLHIALDEVFLLVALAHLAVLQLSQSVDGLVGVQAEGLTDAEVAFVHAFLDGTEGDGSVFSQEHPSVGVGKLQRCRPLVNGHAQRLGAQDDGGVGVSDPEPGVLRGEDDSRTGLLGQLGLGVFHDTDDGGGVELHFAGVASVGHRELDAVRRLADRLCCEPSGAEQQKGNPDRFELLHKRFLD